MHFLGQVVAVFGVIAAVLLSIVVALQSSKSEGLSGVLAGGGGGGGKVGKDAHLDKLSQYLAYGFLGLMFLAAWLRAR
ncbi:MAG: preprotein translocase subunit SecG [Armatimonadetes bacterium]|nr:preprotein translocase subunit SecG [Armatimonadota bacterium]